MNGSDCLAAVTVTVTCQMSSRQRHTTQSGGLRGVLHLKSEGASASREPASQSSRPQSPDAKTGAAKAPSGRKLFELYKKQQEADKKAKQARRRPTRKQKQLGHQKHTRRLGTRNGPNGDSGARTISASSESAHYPPLDTPTFQHPGPHGLRDAFAVAQDWNSALQKRVESIWSHDMQSAKVADVLRAVAKHLTGGTVAKLRQHAASVYVELLKRDIVYAHKVARVRSIDHASNDS